MSTLRITKTTDSPNEQQNTLKMRPKLVTDYNTYTCGEDIDSHIFSHMVSADQHPSY
jgi:hypothetical protein